MRMYKTFHIAVILLQFVAMILSTFSVLLKKTRYFLLSRTFFSQKARSSRVYIVRALSSKTALTDITRNEFLGVLSFPKTVLLLLLLLLLLLSLFGNNSEEFLKISDCSKILLIHEGTSQNSQPLWTTFNTAHAW